MTAGVAWRSMLRIRRSVPLLARCALVNSRICPLLLAMWITPHEVRYEAKKTGRSKQAVKRAVKKVGNSRRNVERELD